jgi:hypothetical protein
VLLIADRDECCPSIDDIFESALYLLDFERAARFLHPHQQFIVVAGELESQPLPERLLRFAVAPLQERLEIIASLGLKTF